MSERIKKTTTLKKSTIMKLKLIGAEQGFNHMNEAIEFIVDENTKNLNKKFKDITISDDIIYATIVRDDKIIIPTGDDCLKINDKVIVVSQNKKFEEIIFGGDK